MSDDPTAYFWSIASGLLEEPGVTKSTMMGFPCLRLHGDFFASCEHKTGALIVKLSAERVNECIERGDGLSFSPAGRRFKEWLMIEDQDEAHWSAMIRQALACAKGRAK